MASSSTSLDPALLAAIIADPDNDGVRLVAADWLEEHGEAERAEFIRVQVELARTEGQWVDHARHNMLLRRERAVMRERELLNKDLNEELWLRDLPLLRKAEGQRVVYHWRRGLVEAVTCTAAGWLAHADALLAAQPVREVALLTRPEGHGWRNTPDPIGRLYSDLLAAEWPRVAFRLPQPDLPA